MSKVMKKSSRFFTLSLCIALLITNTLVLAPEVGAASDPMQTATETENTYDSNISTADDQELTLRAIAVDEAKKEAQAAVTEQLAIIAQEEEEAQQEQEEETETPASEAEEPTEEETAAPETEPEEENTSEDESAESSSTSENETEEDTDSDNSGVAAEGFLMGIDNPDPSYVGTAISMSDSDRDLCERMLMGEAGSMGFTGMAIVAQCIRDTYVAGGYTSIAAVISENGYYGSTDTPGDATCKEVVNYIFDQGGSAVQHSVRVFYASDICSSEWHESQEFVCAYGAVRFFDM